MEASDLARQRLKQLRDGLLDLHKALLNSERDAYDRNIARITSSSHLLQLVMHDPWFAWLHELSELVVLIDETLDADDPPAPALADELIQQARMLLLPAENGSGFRKSYFESLQRDPDVVIAHAEMMKVFAGLR